MKHAAQEALLAILETSVLRREEVPALVEAFAQGNAPVLIGGVGVHHRCLFHAARLEEQRPKVQRLIQQVVADEFFEARGGGASVLRLTRTQLGEHWADPPVADVFLCVAFALEEARFCVPDRERWEELPGEMPFVVFRDPAVPFRTVHLLRLGAAACGMPSPPSEWPAGHAWASLEDLEQVNCRGCLLMFSANAGAA